MKPNAIVMLSALATLTALAPAASAQDRVITGPSFTTADVQADRFDAVFDHVVPVFPMYPLFRTQTPAARFDAIVCNTETERRGAVRVSGSDTLGILNPGECTMYANFANLDFSRLDGEYEWTARIYLRAHR